MKTCPVCDTDYPDHHSSCPTDGAPLIGSRELEPGRLVRGKYRIVRQLGEGGMGVVYKADDLLMGVPVALKFGKDPRVIKRFRTEARAAYQLRHPNIVEVTGLDQDEEGNLFIVMECVDGPNLRAEIDKAPAGFAVRRALEVGRDIAAGLAAAHLKGIVHRDIKPENVLLARTANGGECPKIADFGIAAVTESVTRMSRTRGLLLTAEYAAPEQWMEMPANEIDGRTDLYALGCVMYELLTGSPPFHAHNTPEWMQRHLTEPPGPPSRVRPELAAWNGLDALSMRMIAKNRDLRPRDGTEVVRELDAILASAPVAPKGRGAVTLPESGHKPTIRLDSMGALKETSLAGFETYSDEAKAPDHRGRMILLVLLAVAIVAGGATFVWNRLHEAPAVADTGTPGTPKTDGTGAGTPPPGTATVSVTCDHTCDWFVDGQSEGRLAPKRVGQVKVPAGKHYIDAKTSDTGFEQQRRTITLADAEAYGTDFAFAKKTGPGNEVTTGNIHRGDPPPPPPSQPPCDQIARLLVQCESRQSDGGDNPGALKICKQAANLDPHDLCPRIREVRDKIEAIQEECNVNHDPACEQTK